MFKKILRRGLPVWILAIGIAIYYFMMVTKPVAEQRNPPITILKVQALRLEPQQYRVVVDSQGVVSARTESTLIPEVSGKIMSVSPNFREGGFFSEGEILLVIDQRDYIAAVTIAEANLAEARLRLAEEEAATSQAEKDWERLGTDEAPSDLVLRQPQLALARATVSAAEARVEQAHRDLKETRVLAPFEGRILEQRVDVGQVVSPGTVLAEIYAVDYAEIRLPLTTEEFANLDLPPLVRGEVAPDMDNQVVLEADFGRETITWTGRIVRVEGAVDVRSRQIYVVGQVDDPYGPNHDRPLKVGMFVEARIEGQILENVFVLPRLALREGAFILTIDQENSIRRKQVDLLWSNADVIVFRSDEIKPGTLVSLTQMTLALDGMKVVPLINGESSPPSGEKAQGLAGNPDTQRPPEG